MLLENRRVSPKSFAFSSKNSAFSGVFSPFLAHWREKINSRSSTLFATRECRQDSPPDIILHLGRPQRSDSKKEWNSETSASTNENGEAYLSLAMRNSPCRRFSTLPHRARRGERPCFAQPRNENGKQKKADPR